MLRNDYELIATNSSLSLYIIIHDIGYLLSFAVPRRETYRGHSSRTTNIFHYSAENS